MKDIKVKKKGSYHHGDLRRALVEASLQIIADQGVEALTLRSVGRSTGVSHAAPYRHFTDKEALLAAVAIEGFNALKKVLDHAYESFPEDDPVNRLREVGHAYVRFAVANPAYFRVMFGPYILDKSLHEGLFEASISTLDVVAAGIAACQEADIVRPGNARELALVAWSTVHGLSSLLLDGQIEMRSGELASRLTDSALNVLQEGLAVR